MTRCNFLQSRRSVVVARDSKRAGLFIDEGGDDKHQMGIWMRGFDGGDEAGWDDWNYS